MSGKSPSKEQCLRDAESMRAELGHMRAAWEGAEQRAKDAREEALRQAEALFDPRTLSIHHEAWLAVMRGGHPILRDADLARERAARIAAELRVAELEASLWRCRVCPEVRISAESHIAELERERDAARDELGRVISLSLLEPGETPTRQPEGAAAVAMWRRVQECHRERAAREDAERRAIAGGVPKCQPSPDESVRLADVCQHGLRRGECRACVGADLEACMDAILLPGDQPGKETT